MKKRLPILFKGTRNQIKGTPWTGKANVSFKPQLQGLFPEVELIEINGEVQVFRLLYAGPTRGMDVLIHEFTVKFPIGRLIEYLLKHDSQRTLRRDKRLEDYLKRLNAHEKNKQSAEEKYIEDRKERALNEARWLSKGKHSINIRGKPCLTAATAGKKLELTLP